MVYWNIVITILALKSPFLFIFVHFIFIKLNKKGGLSCYSATGDFRGRKWD
jgi:hypothetical protein